METNRAALPRETLPMPLQTTFFDKTLTTEVASDFVLPDYQPEIRKLLRVTPSLTPPSRFLGAGEAEFAGNAEVSVLYMGADGAVYSTSLALPYEWKVPFEGNEHFAGAGGGSVGGDDAPEIETDTLPDAVIARVLGPRKLNLRVRLRSHVVGRCQEDMTVTVEGTAGREPLQKLEQIKDCAVICRTAGDPVELSDSFEPEKSGDELRLIESRGQALVSEAAVTEDGVACRGEVYLRVLYTCDGEEPDVPECMVRRIPFSVTVPMPTDVAGSGREVCATAECTALTCRVEDGKILCALSLVPEARLIRTDRVTFVRDCFGVEHETECVTQEHTYLRPLMFYNGNMTHTATLGLADMGLPAGAQPFDTFGEASSSKVTAERGRLVLEADCHYTTLWRQSDGEMGSCEYHVPMRFELPGERLGALPEGPMPESETRLTMLTGRVRGEGETVALDAEWAVCAGVFSTETVTAVTRVRVGEELPARGAAYILCYPETGDTLWSIAKRYHTSVRGLAGANGLSGATSADAVDSLENATFIMV